jgi:hypothetical protein
VGVGLLFGRGAGGGELVAQRLQLGIQRVALLLALERLLVTLG